MRLGLDHKGSHVILNVLLHKQIFVRIVIKHHILFILIHDLVDPIILIEIQWASLLSHISVILFLSNFSTMLLHEQSELFIDLILG